MISRWMGLVSLQCVAAHIFFDYQYGKAWDRKNWRYSWIKKTWKETCPCLCLIPFNSIIIGSGSTTVTSTKNIYNTTGSSNNEHRVLTVRHYYTKLRHSFFFTKHVWSSLQQHRRDYFFSLCTVYFESEQESCRFARNPFKLQRFVVLVPQNRTENKSVNKTLV